jgi:hypothetical protein
MRFAGGIPAALTVQLICKPSARTGQNTIASAARPRFVERMHPSGTGLPALKLASALKDSPASDAINKVFSIRAESAMCGDEPMETR